MLDPKQMIGVRLGERALQEVRALAAADDVQPSAMMRTLVEEALQARAAAADPGEKTAPAGLEQQPAVSAAMLDERLDALKQDLEETITLRTGWLIFYHLLILSTLSAYWRWFAASHGVDADGVNRKIEKLSSAIEQRFIEEQEAHRFFTGGSSVALRDRLAAAAAAYAAAEAPTPVEEG